MKMKELSTIQKKKLWYSLLGFILISIAIATGFLLWDNGNLSIDQIKTRIVTSFASYLSLTFLGFKVIWFFSVELKRKKQRVKEISETIIEESRELINMSKKTKKQVISTPKSSLLSFTFDGANFTCELKNSKEIVITAKNGFTSSQDFYNKLKSDISNFRDYVGKVVSGDVEIKK